MLDFKPIGRRIKSARKARNLTQENLSELIDVTGSYISVIERGVKTPTLDTFIKIANALKVNSDSLLKDVLDTSTEMEASELFKEIKNLPVKEQRKILKVVRIMVEKDT